MPPGSRGPAATGAAHRATAASQSRPRPALPGSMRRTADGAALNCTSLTLTATEPRRDAEELRRRLRHLVPRRLTGVHAVIESRRRAGHDQVSCRRRDVGRVARRHNPIGEHTTRRDRPRARTRWRPAFPSCPSSDQRRRTGSRRAGRRRAGRRAQTIRRAASTRRRRSAATAVRPRRRAATALPSNTKSVL